MRDVLDSKRDADKHFWTLQSHPVDGIVYGLTKEVSLVRRMWRLSAANGQRVRQCQGSAKSPAMTITTLAGHVSTVVDTAALPTIEPTSGVASGR